MPCTARTAVRSRRDRRSAAGRGSWHRLQLELEGGSAGVRGVRLPPDLDGERHKDERVQELEQTVCVLGQVIERKFVQVGDRLLGSWKEGIVECLHLVHAARKAFCIALGLAGEAPLFRKRLEVGELWGEQGIGHRSYTSAR